MVFAKMQQFKNLKLYEVRSKGAMRMYERANRCSERTVVERE